MTSSGCITVTERVGWSAVVFCACEIILLCSVLLCVFTDKHIYICLPVNEKSNNWRPVFVKILRSALIETHVL